MSGCPRDCVGVSLLCFDAYSEVVCCPGNVSLEQVVPVVLGVGVCGCKFTGSQESVKPQSHRSPDSRLIFGGNGAGVGNLCLERCQQG